MDLADIVPGVEVALGTPAPVEGIRTYVDDLKLTRAGPAVQAAAGLKDMVVGLKRELDRDGTLLELSKCQALGSTPAHRRALSSALGGLGVQTVGVARDLGTDAAPGNRRRVTVLKGRLKAGSARLRRLARAPLPRRRRAIQAKSLGTTVATYGV